VSLSLVGESAPRVIAMTAASRAYRTSTRGLHQLRSKHFRAKKPGRLSTKGLAIASAVPRRFLLRWLLSVPQKRCLPVSLRFRQVLACPLFQRQKCKIARAVDFSLGLYLFFRGPLRGWLQLIRGVTFLAIGRLSRRDPSSQALAQRFLYLRASNYDGTILSLLLFISLCLVSRIERNPVPRKGPSPGAGGLAPY